MKRILFILSFLLLITLNSLATHQRAGEITYKWIGGSAYEITIVTYTYTPSLADRPDLDVNWGDQTTGNIERVEKVDIGNNISRNTYKYNGPGTGGRHTYGAPGTYIISVEDPNRNAGIINIPNSVNIPFYLETEIVINPFLGINNSVILQNPPIDNACVFQPYMHNPWAFDPDGDSLSYRLAYCKGQGGIDIPGYSYPYANNTFNINPITGDLLWDSPQQNGEFNIAIIVEEWRKGEKIGSVRRDMQITVVPCNNKPPKIALINDTCVLAGTQLKFKVTATDTAFNTITLTGNGTPLVISVSPATFPQPVQGMGTVSSTFTWNTVCEHVKKQAYQMNFKAKDNGYPVNLVTYKSLKITIVCPRPENLTAVPVGNTIHLNWNKDVCTNAIGYKIYRHSGYTGFIPANCETGIPAYTGYVEIATIPNIYDTSYVDNNNGQGLVLGNEYCYMVYAYFADGAESYASLEACAELNKDVPVITNVSVRNTDLNNGSMLIGWSKPSALDTTLHHGPFKYLIYRGTSNSGLSLIDSINNITDTTYIDSLINTKDVQYKYRIDFYNDSVGKRYLIGTTNIANSVYLAITATDQALILNWDVDVPWTNIYYAIYRLNPSTSLYDSIGVSLTTNYTDYGLINGTNYCYYIKSIGKYTASGFAFPLINLSEISCGIPLDNVPPCPPILSVTPDCKSITNFAIWTNLYDSCSSDIIKYSLYFSQTESSDYNIIYISNNIADTTYLHTGLYTIAGCYYLTATDSNGNISDPSNKVCIDIDLCQLYNLPNVFTPNGDGSNDYFKPFPYDFVESINIKVFNRWGEPVFESTDPNINWDGKNQTTKLDCSEGVYFFVCDVFERRLNGIEKRTITGVVNILR
jgi:gliding motility-associated-like protein